MLFIPFLYSEYPCVLQLPSSLSNSFPSKFQHEKEFSTAPSLPLRASRVASLFLTRFKASISYPDSQASSAPRLCTKASSVETNMHCAALTKGDCPSSPTARCQLKMSCPSEERRLLHTLSPTSPHSPHRVHHTDRRKHNLELALVSVVEENLIKS